MSLASCPRCGAPIHFPIGSGATVVCASCRSVVARTDRGLEPLGQVADVSRGDASLAIGDKGKAGGHSFTVAGVINFAHTAGGSWEEYTVYVGDALYVLSHAQGRWALLSAVAPQVFEPPAIGALRVGADVVFGPFGRFRVAEIGKGTMTGGEGELARGASPDAPVLFVDLDGEGDAVASIDYGDGTKPPVAYVGTKMAFAALQITRAGIARGEHAATKSYTCPNCGAPLDLLTGAAALSVSCKYCGTVSEPEGAKIVSKIDLAGRSSDIPLGTKGKLRGVEWTVVGYMTRSATEDGDTYSWQEYLMYEIGQGFAWLVQDDEGYWLSVGVSSAEMSDVENGRSLTFRGQRYRMRNATRATVLFVIGEFYWKVRVGESVIMTDYVCKPLKGAQMGLAQEASGDEVNWSHSQKLDASEVQAAFGIAMKAAAPGNKGLSPVEIFIVVVLLLIVISIIGAVLDNGCTGGGGGGGSSYGGVRGGFGGGFGGK